MIYRPALYTDHTQIALLHADSWRRTYRGLFSDAFLEHEAEADRIQVWQERLGSPAPNQCVVVAENATGVQGFVCVYGNDDPQWGSLVDNLHVAHAARRQGIGRRLLSHAFAWLAQEYAEQAVYLWVMETNQVAREFYQSLGSGNAGVIDKPNPVGGGSARNCRYVWSSPRYLCNPLSK